MFWKKKKVEKKIRELTTEQKEQLKEQEKWIKILQNVTAYDGTGKGQITIER